MKNHFTIYQKRELVKRYLKGESIQKLLQEAKVSRVSFDLWIKDYKAYCKNLSTQKKKLSPRVREEIIKRAATGEAIAQLGTLYGISRKTIYKWYNRFQEGKEKAKEENFSDRIPTQVRYYRQTPENYEEAVLDGVRKYPQLSPHRLPYVLPHIGDKPIVSSHGVQNILRRHNLARYEDRLSYANSYASSFVFSRLLQTGREWLANFFTKSHRYRQTAVRLGTLISLALGVTIVLAGLRDLVSSLQAGSSFSYLMLFPLSALIIGMGFFIYSLKYYFSIALVLSFSRHQGEETKLSKKSASTGLMDDISHVRLTRHPFVSIHLAMYNEKRVIERLLTAATSMDYDNYEVIVADDSTDEEVLELLKKWQHNKRVKILHRESRDGYKGQALQNALHHTDKRAEFILVFDADFIPYPDSITQFLKYFQSVVGNLSSQELKNSHVAAVQGYQWHVLNKSENWLTRGVRSEYSGSYVVERSSIEVYGGLKQISGSVYMIRKDVLEKIGWGRSITEDFELTLKLYKEGFKVVYTPYVQAPAEAVSTLRRLIRQRMRWAEGHSHNVKRFFWKLLFSKNTTASEKAEFVYLAPYYLQAGFFLLGTFFWFLSEAIFRIRLPFWTEIWGWSLILTNMVSLPLVNLVGLFLEEADDRDYLGLLSFVAMSYVVAPFQAYAAVKGFLEKEEGPWFRTPKTGRITDTFVPGKFYRYLRQLFGQEKRAPALSMNPYLTLATAHNRFNDFSLQPKRVKWLGKSLIAFFLIFSLLMTSLAVEVPFTQAAANQVFLLSTVSGTDTGYPNVSTSKEFNATANTSPTANTVACTSYGKAAAGTTEMFFPTGSTCGATSTSESAGARGWFLNSQSGQYPSGSWSFTVSLNSATVGGTAGNFMLFAAVYVYNGSTYTRQFYSIYKNASQACSTTRPARTTGTSITPSTTTTDFTWTCTSAPLVDLGTNKNLYVEYFVEINTASSNGSANVSVIHNGNAANNGDSSVTTTTFGVPENGWILLPIVPFVPKIIEGMPALLRRYSQYMKKRRKRKL